ncbi:MAG: 50S ribosomal protein L4 [Crocinitomicaceae bacterium]|nr:50S ribosomal protein L4 [Crocinitomicaceae bacterium]|tara:strand:- start:17228 stop:17854 length:627 start_codon:yes stop_codon:yes gene_type:complete
MKVDIYKADGSKASKKAELKDSIFGAEVNEHAIYLDVKQYLAHQRQGTHSSKERAQIVGSTRKIKKQKGTGTARAGSIKSPIFRGGGRVFGPEPRFYGFKVNKKTKQVARKSALSSKAKADEIMVVDKIELKAPKTSDMVKLIDNLKLSGKKTLLVLPEPDKNVYLSTRNLRAVSYITASELNTYSILNNEKVVFCEASIGTIESILS